MFLNVALGARMRSRARPIKARLMSVSIADICVRCFGDKGDVEDITEGQWLRLYNDIFFRTSYRQLHVPFVSISIVQPYADIPLFTADIISTVEFDHTGNYLATGDKGGRVVLFERNETVCRSYIFLGLRTLLENC